MLSFAAARARAEGAGYLWLVTLSSNTTAIAGYSRMANIHQSVESYAFALATFAALADAGEREPRA